MKRVLKRSLAMMLALMMSVSLFFGVNLSADAANVDYVYAGNYILNWGVRGTDATFLSQNAEQFYEDNNTSYMELAALSGSSTISSVPSSALYEELQDLMTDNHSHITSYDETKSLFQYTDCQNSGKISNKISSFYSGTEVGPAWDSGATWNREHTWPNSKASGSGENDIMMLRPASGSENSSRGNKAYGEGSSYYDPNQASNGTYNLHGDVARIMLYQYVRWGMTSNMWGVDGVIESKEVLLDWMEEDPVDTWELGRNDAVETITGTRNVFVDYPELVFILFGEEIPANYTTPSGNASQSEYEITAHSNISGWGSVSVSGNVINASPATGYEATGYTILSGDATVVQSGNTFTVSATSDVSIRINFAARAEKTIRFMELGTVASTQTAYAGDVIQLPAHIGSVQEGHTFIGWVSSSLRETATTPEFYAVGSNYTVTDSVSLYALYSRVVQDGSSNGAVFEPYSGELTEGDYLVVSDGGAMTASISSGRLVVTDIEITGTNIINTNGALVWQLAKDGDYWTFYNASTEKYAAGTGAKNKAQLITGVSDYARFSASKKDGNTYDFLNKGNNAAGVNALLRRNGTYGFACYTNSGTTGSPLSLYKRSSGTTYYFTIINDSDAGGSQGGNGNAAPTNLGVENETIYNKADGRITGVDSGMEYRMEGESTYREITGNAIADLQGGTYYVRYKADGTNDPSSDAEVTVAAGAKLKVVLPSNQIGYTVTTSLTEYGWHDEVAVSLALSEGYDVTDDFKVYFNEADRLWGKDQRVDSVDVLESDLIITVYGIADMTAPQLTLTYGSNIWNTLLKVITFGIYKSDSVQLELAALDAGSGIDKIEYYIADEDLIANADIDNYAAANLIETQVSDWTTYELGSKIKFKDNQKNVLYLKATDKAGNVSYINSEGVVIDTLAPVISGIENGQTYYGDVTINVNDELVGVGAVKVDGIEVTLTEGTYTIVADNKEHTVEAEDKAGNKSSYTFTVYEKNADEIAETDEPTQTSDYNNVWVWLLLAVTCGSLVIFMSFRKKREE